ncbi:FAD-dependent oxidoreductase [Paenibacillus rhizoplanae]
MSNTGMKAVTRIRFMQPYSGRKRTGSCRRAGTPSRGLSWVADYLVGVNFGHVFGIDGVRAEDLTRGAIEGRKLVRRQLEFFRAYVPGFEQAHLVSTGEQIGIRETRRIIGDYVLTQEDFMNMASFPDDIARNSYFIDIHMARSSGRCIFTICRPVSPTVFPTAVCCRLAWRMYGWQGGQPPRTVWCKARCV